MLMLSAQLLHKNQFSTNSSCFVWTLSWQFRKLDARDCGRQHTHVPCVTSACTSSEKKCFHSFWNIFLYFLAFFFSVRPWELRMFGQYSAIAWDLQLPSRYMSEIYLKHTHGQTVHRWNCLCSRMPIRILCQRDTAVWTCLRSTVMARTLICHVWLLPAH